MPLKRVKHALPIQFTHDFSTCTQSQKLSGDATHTSFFSGGAATYKLMLRCLRSGKEDASSKNSTHAFTHILP